MSYSRNPMRKEDYEYLINARVDIMGATDTAKIEEEVSALEVRLHEMELRSCGQELHVINKIQKKIKGFWLHDEPRTEVVRWVNSLIIYLK